MKFLISRETKSIVYGQSLVSKKKGIKKFPKKKKKRGTDENRLFHSEPKRDERLQLENKQVITLILYSHGHAA